MSNITHFCFLMPGMVFGLCALNVVTDSLLTQAVSAMDTGQRLPTAGRGWQGRKGYSVAWCMVEGSEWTR